MRTTLGFHQSLAGGASQNIVIPTTQSIHNLSALVSAMFGSAVAGTNGIQLKFQQSGDGGTTYQDVPGVTVTIPGVISTQASAKLQNDWQLRDLSGPVDHVKIVVTNLDATNAVNVVCAYEPGKY
ncbi:MAG: hypothetical protein JWL83_73 [Actinomycetia bacterium]|nr:hypothetical protein [Actinomycetes bacterium]